MRVVQLLLIKGRADRFLRGEAGGVFGRPTLDEAVLVAFALLAFIAVQLGAREDDPVVEPEPTPAPVAATLAATPVATSAARSVATPVAPSSSPVAPVATPAVGPDTCDFRDELERVRGSVVRIRSARTLTSGSIGTGFHIGGGQYVTAAHVVQDESGNMHQQIWVESAATGQYELAVVVRVGSFSMSATAQERDLAVLRAPPIEHAIEYRAPTADDVERDVRALGYPWSQAQDQSADIPPPVVVRGVLSNTAVRDNISVVQADVQAQSGMSGGPLVDECGFALAVTSAMPQAQGGEIGEGLTVFISMAELKNLR